jgi:RND family efflux transporter MFP subunit
VTVSQPLQRTVTDHADFISRTEPSAKVLVRSRVAGKLIKAHRQADEAVKKDDPLFDLDEKPLQAALKKAQDFATRLNASREKRKAVFEEAEKRREAGAIQQEELDLARHRLDKTEEALVTARAALKQARLDLSFAQIKAPMAGDLGPLQIPVGGEVSSQSVLAVLSAHDPIHVRLHLEEREELAGAPLLLGLADEKGFPHRGTVTFLEGPSRGKPGPITVLGAFPNADGRIPPDRRAWVRRPLSRPYRALLVSEEAVKREGRQDYLLVVTDKNTIEYRKVRLGHLEDGLRVIREGVTASDWVAVTAIQRLRRGEVVEPHQEPMPIPKEHPRLEKEPAGEDKAPRKSRD